MRHDQPMRSRRWRATPRGKYAEAKRRARQRGIAWEFTFDEWWATWQASGHWPMRGTRRAGYVMKRCNDEGPYSYLNCYIGTHISNAVEGWKRGRDIKKLPPLLERTYIYDHMEPPE